MRELIIGLLFGFAMIVNMSCSKNEFVLKDDTILKTNETISGKKIKINFERGEDWFHEQKLFTFNLTITPQVAIWAESIEGKYLQTLYVTRCFAKQEWIFVKNKDDECIRTMCMPYWFNRYLGAGNKKPTKGTPMADAVTGATPTGSFVLESTLNQDTGNVILFVELNKSFDHYGEFSKERKSAEFNGQPSIIYKAEVDLSSNVKSVEFKAIGYGGETGDDPKINDDIEKVKRAQTMVKSITANIL